MSVSLFLSRLKRIGGVIKTIEGSGQNLLRHRQWRCLAKNNHSLGMKDRVRGKGVGSGYEGVCLKGVRRGLLERGKKGLDGVVRG